LVTLDMWISGPLWGTVADSPVLHGLANGPVTARIIWHIAWVNALVINAGPVGGALFVPLTANLNRITLGIGIPCHSGWARTYGPVIVCLTNGSRTAWI